MISKAKKKLFKAGPLLLFALSFVLVAFGQNAWLSASAFFASFLGYALFWKSMFFFSSVRRRFFLAFFWFVFVSAVQLSWMTSTEYQGVYILFVYSLLLIGLGAQFAFLSFIIAKDQKLPMRAMLGCASFWVLMEWSRLWLLSGFTWNPAGLALCFHHVPMQMASLAGVYGLSFWVIFTNLMALKALFTKDRRSLVLFLIAALVPYLFGIVHEGFWKSRFSQQKGPLSVLLVQTSLLPEEKDLYMDRLDVFISPHLQWERILSFLVKEKGKKADLIVLPETAVPFGAFRTFYPIAKVKDVWKRVFGEEALTMLPELKEPLAAFNVKSERWEVSNSYWAQAVSNFFDTEVIIGLDDRDLLVRRNYNAAFYFQPFGFLPKRYEKRVLVPIAEYFPYSWCGSIAKKFFGISDQFSSGKRAKVFSGANHYGISICYEETYAHLVRQSRSLGASCFVNISNDVWFPSSRLPRQHFELGRIRAVENGVPCVRACNTGVTGGVDCFGRCIGFFQEEGKSVEKAAGSYFLTLPIHSYPTLYTLCGDHLIVSISSFFLLFYLLKDHRQIFPKLLSFFQAVYRRKFGSKLRLPKKE